MSNNPKNAIPRHAHSCSMVLTLSSKLSNRCPIPITAKTYCWVSLLIDEPVEDDRRLWKWRETLALHLVGLLGRNGMGIWCLTLTPAFRSLDTLTTPARHILWDVFQLITPENVDTLVGSV